MKFLENRIPPPIVLLVALILIGLVANFDRLWLLPMSPRLIGTGLFVAIGIGLSVAGLMSFKRAETTINPLLPSSASSLVSTGIYRYTRNPMYLGMLFITIAACVYFSSVGGLVVVAGFFFYLDRLQIEPEERAMLDLFGDEFKAYKQEVRRWI